MWDLTRTVRGWLRKYVLGAFKAQKPFYLFIYLFRMIIGWYQGLLHPPLQTKCIQNNAGGGQVVKSDRKWRALWKIWHSFWKTQKPQSGTLNESVCSSVFITAGYSFNWNWRDSVINCLSKLDFFLFKSTLDDLWVWSQRAHQALLVDNGLYEVLKVWTLWD